MGGELRLHLVEEGAGDERTDELTRLLRAELRRLDVEDVRAPAGEAAPPGARGLDAEAAGALLISLGPAADSLRAVVGTLRQWLGRGGGVRRTVRMELDGDVLELSEVSAGEQQRLIDLFVGRYAARDDPR
ncbi:hypothetical protein [Symbioplanes lichenis]|uniref:hypothetical protein n=1 Tax=Symbioplanes lichenis TaxID=1629072 RepID=UPI00273926F6|nr:hypothetical protein [Actinoplanes lichenis]